MNKILKSRKLTSLAGHLAGQMDQYSGSDPLQPQTIIVPNLDTARWVKLFLAKNNGIAANIEFLLPSEWQYRQIRKLYPELPKKLPSDILPMSWSIFQVLMNQKTISQFPKLQRYIVKQEDARKETEAWKLAKQIASVFDEYMVYRPQLIMKWQSGKIGKDDEQWQADLWRLLNKKWKTLGNEQVRKNRMELFGELLQKVEDGKLTFESPIYVFNPGLIPEPILKTLNAAGRRTDLFFYYIQPVDDEQLTEENLKNPLLKSLGREAVNIHQTVSKNVNSENEFIGESRSHVRCNLDKVKHSIFSNRALADVSEPDETIQVRSCHSPLREIETLHQFLLEVFENYDDLHPDDVLVVTPEPQKYESFVNAVFNHSETGLPEIPWSLGKSRTADHSAERTLRQLLKLIDSRFTFAGVIDLFMMKPVSEAFGVSETEAYQIRHWMEENHVVWGLNGEHRKEFDQPADDNQTWQAALKRGWLGQWMAAEPGEMAGHTLLFHGVESTSEKEAWASFSKFLNRLDDFRKSSKQKRHLEEWQTWLNGLLKEFFTDSYLASRQGMQLLNVLDTFCDCGRIVNYSGKISFSMIRSEILSSLEQTRSTGAFFTRGVTFSSMVPVRSIPFKVIALIGLNETDFPRKPGSPDFDLLAQNPAAGDRNRKLEDRNLFLHTILAAENIHYCSYIGQSPVDNESIPPSPIVHEWVDYLSKLCNCEKEEIIQKEPLNSFSPTHFKNGRSYSELNYKILKTREEEDEEISGIEFPGKFTATKLSDDISVSDLARFFRNPVRWFVGEQLEARLSQPDEEKNEFQADHLEKHLLFQRVFGWMLDGIPDEKMRSILLQSGALPAGWPGERMLQEIMGNVRIAMQELKTLEIEPKITQKEISVWMDQKSINGTVASYTDDFLLDITPSKFSGSIALEGWIRHLCWQASENQSNNHFRLLCDLKKGAPIWILFKPVQNAEEILRELIVLFERSQGSPLPFFPKTVYAYEEAERDKKKKDPIKKAALEFEGSDFSFAERDDLSIAVLMGENTPFREDFVSDEYRKIVQIMMDNMEVL